MTDKPGKARTAAAGKDLAERMAATLGPPAPSPRTPRPRAAPMPAEQDRTKTWPERIPLTVDKDMKRALELAKVEDGSEATTRIRAMIMLWQENERFRSQVDRLARTDRRLQGSRRVRPR